MAARDVIFHKQHESITQLRDILREHAPEVAQRLELLSPGGAVPNTAKNPDLYATYLAEAIIATNKRLDEIEARSPMPKRGRPPKNTQRDQGLKDSNVLGPKRRGRPPKGS